MNISGIFKEYNLKQQNFDILFYELEVSTNLIFVSTNRTKRTEPNLKTLTSFEKFGIAQNV